jgi:DNA-binding transcriptional MerR regulator
MATPPDDDADRELGWGVGTVAARLGISASTLRTWERRYDVGPSRRTAGGHRRYSEADIERALLTQLFIARGAPPSDAARVAHSLDDDGLASALDSEHGLAEPQTARPSEVVPALLDAAMADDPRLVGRLVADAFKVHGAIGAWTEIIAPALVQIGLDWSAGRFRLEAEHLASDAIVKELRAYVHGLQEADRTEPTVVLASAEDEEHTLPVFAVEAALAEVGVGALVLGARLPTASVASIAQRLGPRVIFLWASMPRSEQDPIWDVLATEGDDTTVILGGPGWSPQMAVRLGLGRAVAPPDLPSTIEGIVGALESSTHR